MKLKTWIPVSALLFLVFVISCSPYKQLKPTPELSFKEQGYIELKDDKKDFLLKAGKKYYITFPPAEDSNFYLVLDVVSKNQFSTFLTDTYDKKTVGEKISDEAIEDRNQIVYPISNAPASYYWMIEKIQKETILTMKYRYVPQWRFKFENKHAEFKATLEMNTIPQKVYEGIGTTTSFKNFPFAKTIATVEKKTKALEEVHDQLVAIENIFPQSILNSKDEAYLNYKELKKKIEEELGFQSRYHQTLTFFYTEYRTRGKTGQFLDAIDVFIEFLDNKDTHPLSVVQESKKVINRRLGEIVPHYNTILSKKTDAGAFDSSLYKLAALNKIKPLYQTTEVPSPRGFSALYTYVTDFNEKSVTAENLRDELSSIIQRVDALSEMPDNTFFSERLNSAQKVLSAVPNPLGKTYGAYSTYTCSKALNEKLKDIHSKAASLTGQYRTASELVPELNKLRANMDYRGMLGILLQYGHLDFLTAKYQALDKMSIEQQFEEIKTAIESSNYKQAEQRLKVLHEDRLFLNPAAIVSIKSSAVQDMESTLFDKINAASKSRVMAFLDANIDTLENIDSLYEDSAFLPVYVMTFSSGSRAALQKKNEKLQNHLDRLKQFDFPQNAIKHLYNKFIKNPDENGVLRARAIVAHGKHYKGEDKKTKRRMAECNPWSSKWIVIPKQYRRVFALPLTSNKNGVNRYLFRLNIRIPTEAKFPVYDINVKLPRELAQNASNEQWYEKITLNKNLIKNEGRFTITAPTGENNYECQISPIRMIKDKNNYLAVYFEHKSFKPIPISIMVQKPIIKKN